MSIDPSSLRADARRNYNRLLQAAQTILAAQGQLPNLENIAKKAGVGVGTLYRHFPTRQALLEAIYAEKLTDLVTRARMLVPGEAPDKALTAWLQAAAEYRVSCNGFDDLMDLALKDKDSPVVQAGAELLSKAQTTGILRPDVTILDFLRLMGGIAANDTSPAERKRVNELVATLVNAFRPTEPTPREKEA